MQEQRALGNILVRHGVVAVEALEPFYAQQREKATPLFELLLTSKLASPSDLARALASECQLPFLETIDVDSVAPRPRFRVTAAITGSTTVGSRKLICPPRRT